mgnify:CR=1 FL=1
MLGPRTGNVTGKPMEISKPAYAEYKGVPETTVDGWINRYFTRGFEYGVVGRVTLIQVDRADKCLRKQAGLLESDQAEAVYSSESGKTASSSITKRSPAKIQAPGLRLPQQLGAGNG